LTEREMLESILQKVTGMEVDVTELKTDVTELKTDVKELKIDVKELKIDVTGIKTKLDVVHEQTAQLTEDMSELKAHIGERIEPKLDELSRELTFLRHKETTNEKDIFFLKQARLA